MSNFTWTRQKVLKVSSLVAGDVMIITIWDVASLPDIRKPRVSLSWPASLWVAAPGTEEVQSVLRQDRNYTTLTRHTTTGQQPLSASAFNHKNDACTRPSDTKILKNVIFHAPKQVWVNSVLILCFCSFTRGHLRPDEAIGGRVSWNCTYSIAKHVRFQMHPVQKLFHSNADVPPYKRILKNRLLHKFCSDKYTTFYSVPPCKHTIRERWNR